MEPKNQLERIYDAERAVPEYGDLDEIRRLGRRRRSRTRIATGTLAAAGLAVIGAAVPNLVSSTNTDSRPAAERPSASPSGPESSAPPMQYGGGGSPFVNLQPGSAAAPGTLAYRECDSACTLYLTAPGLETVDVGEQIPDLQPAIGSADLQLATLSFDSQWIGIPDGQSYLVASLRPAGKVARVPDAPEGERWEPIGWTPSSGSLALARTGPSGATGFAMVDTFDPSGQKIVVHELPTNPLPEWVPVSNGGDSVEVARPAGSGALLQQVESRLVFVSSDQFKPGDVAPSNEAAFDLTSCLEADQSIQAPTGALALLTPPAPKSPNVSEGALTTMALVFDQNGAVPNAVVGFNCSRYELANSSSAVVPRTTDSSHVLVQDGDSTQVLLESAGRDGEVVFEIDNEVDTVLPGQTAALVGRD